MRGKPSFGPCNNLIQRLRLRRALQFGLTFALFHPQNGIIAVAIDGLVEESLLPAERQGMHNGQELADVVRSLDRTKMNQCPGIPSARDCPNSRHPPPTHRPSPLAAMAAPCRYGNREDSVDSFPFPCKNSANE